VKEAELAQADSHPAPRLALFWRVGSFTLFNLLFVILFWKPLFTLGRFSLENENCSHIIVIPLVSAFLIFQNRSAIFRNPQSGFLAGIPLLLAGLTFYLLTQRYSLAWSENDRLSAEIFSLVLVWIGSFLLHYGATVFRAALFPLTFLLLMVPLPDRILTAAVAGLQQASSVLAFYLFRAAGLVAFRQGVLIFLPFMTVDVAPECSGIRSSMALFITGLLFAHLFLRKGWTKLSLLALTVPLAILKNGIRIASLCLLAFYVDPSFLTGNLHHSGGVVFFALALAILTLFLRLLQRWDVRPRSSLTR
jgi:exosortase